jgi:DNA methylase
MAELDKQARLVYSGTGMTYQKRYLDESKGVPLQDWWDDISMVRGIQRRSPSNYPTEKPEALIARIMDVGTNSGDLILDCFIGSGTTAAVAQKLGRRWIGCDINKGAIQTTSKRLQTIITEQVAERARRKKNPELIKDENAAPEPAQYGFTVYRVNDYDLQIQHNEAVALACEHIGVTRTRADAFFDGTLGKRLVKIIPFNHPLSLLDMEEVRKELDARPEEQRDIMIVALGKELAVEKWLDDWNRLRKRSEVPNRIEVVELRTDPKYGKFFAHRPATAKVEIKRLKNKLTIEIQDFISPTIIERLEDQSGILMPKITDWRAMVDCVMIDPAFDGAVFNVALSDIPEKKTDLVQGVYEIDLPSANKTAVAVKILDMLGEEVLVTGDV